jgi:hypothetical protein
MAHARADREEMKGIDGCEPLDLGFNFRGITSTVENVNKFQKFHGIPGFVNGSGQ